MDVRSLVGEFAKSLEAVGRRVWDEAPPVDAPRARLEGDRLSDLLPYHIWDDERGLFQQKRSSGFVLEVTPLLGADEALGQRLGDLLNDGLPDKAVFQALVWASDKVGAIVDAWRDARAGQGAIYEELARHRRDHFCRSASVSASKHAPFLLRDFRVYISVEVPGDLEGANAVELISCRDKMIAEFRTIGSTAIVVKPKDLIGLAADVLNRSTSVRSMAGDLEYDPERSISEQIVQADTTMMVYRDRLEIQTTCEDDGYRLAPWEKALGSRTERWEARGYSVRQYPQTWTQGGMSRLLGDIFNDQVRLGSPTLISLCCSPWDYEKSRSKTEFKRMRTDQAANGPTGRMFPGMRKAAEDWARVSEDVADGARLAQMGLFAMTFNRVGEGDLAERSIRAVFRNCGFLLQRDDDVHLQTLLTCLPMTLGGGMDEDLAMFGRLRTMPTTVAARLAPLQGEYLGGHLPHMMLVGRRGQIFYFSNFSNTGGNHNMIVVGSSGSGKSVFIQELAAGLRGSGAEVVVIDDGRSFMNSCLLQGGAFISFRMDLAVCMNPFSMADHDLAGRDGEYAAEMKKSIMLMVEVMARGQTRATAEEAGVIEMVVSKVWETHGANGSITQVSDELNAPEFGERGQNLALSLAAYTESGTYGAFFNGKANLDISNPYTVFEMGELETKRDLRSVIILGILNLIRQRMAKGGRAKRKALIIDEAWQLLGDGATGDFIEGFARRCRKEGGALITGTQSINDYYKTSGAQACIENSDWSAVLRLKPEALDQLKKNDRMATDESTMQIYKSLRTSDGEYSEILIQSPESRFLGRLALDPFSGTLYSTKPEVFAAVERHVASGSSLEEAVRLVAFGGKTTPERAAQ